MVSTLEKYKQALSNAGFKQTVKKVETVQAKVPSRTVSAKEPSSSSNKRKNIYQQAKSIVRKTSGSTGMIKNIEKLEQVVDTEKKKKETYFTTRDKNLPDTYNENIPVYGDDTLKVTRVGGSATFVPASSFEKWYSKQDPSSITGIYKGKQEIWRSYTPSEIKSAQLAGYKASGYVPYSLDIKTPVMYKELGLSSDYKKAVFGSSLGIEGSWSNFEDNYTKKIKSLPLEESLGFAKKYYKWGESELKFEELKEKFGTTTANISLLQAVGKDKPAGDIIKTKEWEEIAGFPSPKIIGGIKITDSIRLFPQLEYGGTTQIRNLIDTEAHALSVEGLGPLDVTTVSVFDYEQASKNIAEKMVKGGEWKETWFENLPARTKIARTSWESTLAAVSFPVTLTQAAIKHFNEGKTLGMLPDIGSELGKRKVTPVEGAIGGTIGEGISRITKGEGSGFFESAQKYPFYTGVATAGELLGFKAVSAGYGLTIKPKISFLKAKYPGFSKTVDFYNTYKPTALFKKGFSNLGKYSIKKIPAIGKNIQKYGGLNYQSINKVYKSIKSSTVGKNIQKWTKGYVRGKEIYLKKKSIVRDSLTKNKVSYNIYKRFEKYSGFGKKTWLSPDDVLKYKPGTRMDYMFKTTKRGPYLDAEHLLEKTVISKPKGRLFTKITKQLDDIRANKTYTFGRYISSKYQLKPPTKLGTLIHNIKTGNISFKPKILKTVERKGLGGYYRELVKPKVKLSVDKIYKIVGKEEAGKGFTMRWSETIRNLKLKTEVIYPWTKNNIKIKTSDIANKMKQLEKGYSYIIQKGKTYYGPLKIKHIGKGSKSVIGDTSFIMKDPKTTIFEKGGTFLSPEAFPQVYGAKWGFKSSLKSKIKTGVTNLKKSVEAVQAIAPELKLKMTKINKPIAENIWKKTRNIPDYSIKIPMSDISYNIKPNIAGLGLGVKSKNIQLQKPVFKTDLKYKPAIIYEPVSINFQDMVNKQSIKNQLDTNSIKIFEFKTPQTTRFKPIQKTKQKQKYEQKLLTELKFRPLSVKTKIPSPYEPQPPQPVKFGFKLKLPILLPDEYPYSVKKPKLKLKPVGQIFKFRKAKIRSLFDSIGGIK